MTDIILFSPGTCGAYLSGVHDADIPADAIEVSLRDWELLLEELGRTPKKIGAGEDGCPVLIDPPPFDVELLESIERGWRDAQLASTDAVVSRHRDELESGISTALTVEQYTEVQDYRRQLRDWPQGTEFPLAGHRPVAPSLLSEQTQ
ncbi:hypothetical protein [Pseudomonas lini]